MIDEPKLSDSFKEWEQKLTRHYLIARRAAKVANATDSQLRLMWGELTAQEIRTIRAVVNYIEVG